MWHLLPNYDRQELVTMPLFIGDRQTGGQTDTDMYIHTSLKVCLNDTEIQLSPPPQCWD